MHEELHGAVRFKMQFLRLPAKNFITLRNSLNSTLILHTRFRLPRKRFSLASDTRTRYLARRCEASTSRDNFALNIFVTRDDWKPRFTHYGERSRWEGGSHGNAQATRLSIWNRLSDTREHFLFSLSSWPLRAAADYWISLSCVSSLLLFSLNWPAGQSIFFFFFFHVQDFCGRYIQPSNTQTNTILVLPGLITHDPWPTSPTVAFSILSRRCLTRSRVPLLRLLACFPEAGESRGIFE